MGRGGAVKLWKYDEAEQLTEPWAVVRDSKGVWRRLTHPPLS